MVWFRFHVTLDIYGACYLISVFVNNACSMCNMLFWSHVKDFISADTVTRTFLMLKVWLLAMQKLGSLLKLCGQILITWMHTRTSHFILLTFPWKK